MVQLTPGMYQVHDQYKNIIPKEFNHYLFPFRSVTTKLSPIKSLSADKKKIQNDNDD